MTAIIPDHLVLAVLPEYPPVAESIAYQLSGLLVVLLALGGIWLMLETIGALFRRSDGEAKSRAAAPTDSPSVVEPRIEPVDVANEPISPSLTHALIAGTVHAAFQGRARIMGVAAVPSPEVQAIIAAAVHSIFDGRARIVAVKPLNTDTSWAREGRRDIFVSHRVR